MVIDPHSRTEFRAGGFSDLPSPPPGRSRLACIPELNATMSSRRRLHRAPSPTTPPKRRGRGGVRPCHWCAPRWIRRCDTHALRCNRTSPRHGGRVRTRREFTLVIPIAIAERGICVSASEREVGTAVRTARAPSRSWLPSARGAGRTAGLRRLRLAGSPTSRRAWSCTRRPHRSPWWRRAASCYRP